MVFNLATGWFDDRRNHSLYLCARYLLRRRIHRTQFVMLERRRFIAGGEDLKIATNNLLCAHVFAAEALYANSHSGNEPVIKPRLIKPY